MTTRTAVDVTGAGDQRRPGWGAAAGRLARRMTRDDFPRGDLAALRRMPPGEPRAPAFWRLMAEEDLLGNPVVESKWALILHGIALMTPTASQGGGRGSAHDPETAVGTALFLGGELRRESGFYSEMRFNRLLAARGPVLHALLVRMFRMLASAGAFFDWREMASFVLNDGFNEEQAEVGRHRIARAYYRAARRHAPTDEA